MTDKQLIDGRQARILVVDDEEIVLSLARDALEDAGYLVELAKDGEKALALIEKEKFDFLLTDIRMPGMNGIELARRAHEFIPSIGIIFITGYANLDSAKDAIKEGAYDYIMKPFELNELRQAVRNAVRKKQKVADKALSLELDKLSGLNQLMHTVSDRQSLMRLSLGFALMQGKASRGKIIYKGPETNEIAIVSTDNLAKGKFEEVMLRFELDYLRFYNEELTLPRVIYSVKEHPLYKKYNESDIELCLTPPKYREGQQIVSAPLIHGDRLYGFLILGYSDEDEKIRENDLKFLSITASQISISLENINLLEESRHAYGRLKDLQDQILQLERMAAKGQMSAEIGHELNNFLGVVSGNLSLMQHSLDNKNYGELHKYLNAVTTNLDNIRKFTDGLIDVSRLKSKLSECNINNTVAEVLEYLKAQNRFENISIIFNKADCDFLTLADAGQFQQLLYNLLNNAADAIHEINDNRHKQIIVDITLSPERDTYTMTVSDNGIGFKGENLKNALKKRFTTKETGHGFGLLVCEKIIKHHQGQFKIESVPNSGTKITIDFPVQSLSPEPVMA